MSVLSERVVVEYPPNPQDVKEQRAVQEVDDALDSVDGPAGDWLQSEFPRDKFDDSSEATDFISTLGDAAETYDMDNDAVRSMLENTDIHVQRGVANHFGAGAFATVDSDGRSEIVLDPDEGINTTGTVAHELAHSLASSNNLVTASEGYNHAQEWSDKGIGI